MRVLVAMSGGVDSSVAAVLCLDAGHEVVGVTLKLWGGATDRGCCSVADVDDARRVADQLGIDHHVFNYAAEFDRHVVRPYLDAHRAASTPNPCIECNRHIKFELLHERAIALGFDAVATGHHARIVARPDGSHRVARGVDRAKDQSYVLYTMDEAALATTLLPVGSMTKDEVRRIAADRGLRTAAKPDSQDVCFIAGPPGRARAAFLGERIPLRPATVLDADGATVGHVDALELLTVGQRRGLGLAGGRAPRYVLQVDAARATVTVGPRQALASPTVALEHWAPAGPLEGPVLAQCSAHGDPRPGTVVDGVLHWERPQRRVAPGQSVVCYDPAAPDEVLGGAIAANG
ncbi:MAG: tRNA 2-thiouridine(34) synthase MnmA [Acidimicrobiia bacterium]